MRARTLLGGLDTQPARKPALIVAGAKVSYGDLAQQVARTCGLFARLEIGPGNRIVVGTADDVAVSVLYAACLLSGATAVLIDPDSTGPEATILVAKVRPQACFLDRELIDRTQALKRTEGPAIVPVVPATPGRTSFGLLLGRRRARADAESFPAVLDSCDAVEQDIEVDRDDVALILFTSGTTSDPKGVELTFGNLAAQMSTFARHFELGPACRVVNHLPLHHTDGLNQGPLLALSTGACWLCPPGPLNLRALGNMLDMIYRERATHLVTVPTVLAMIMRLPAEFDDSLASPEFCFVESTAGYLEQTVWEAFESRFSTRIVNCYGLTETVSEALYCGPSQDTRRVGTIGKPVDCEARIVGEDGIEVSEGEAGELLLRGDNIARGYFEAPNATRSTFRDGWLHTGDLVVRDEAGYYTVVGRKKNVIIRGGLNIYPEDVNTVLARHADVAEVATVGVPDPLLGERVVSCIVSRDGGEASVEVLFEHCRAGLSPQQVPNEIRFVDGLPRGPAGKVELGKLRTLLDRREVDAQTDGSAVHAVMEIAARVFRQPRKALSEHSSEDNTDGWDSLSLLELIVGLEKHFDVEFEPREIMNIRTLGDACRLAERSEP